jgi:toxin HigB-1
VTDENQKREAQRAKTVHGNGQRFRITRRRGRQNRDMLSFLQDMGTADELRTVPSWKAHQLTGDRKGTWALHVTKNWRMTFQIDQTEIEIIDLDYEDYH